MSHKHLLEFFLEFPYNKIKEFKMLKGKVRKDFRTKNLLKRIRKGEIALIAHEDLDFVSAQGLVEKNVMAVLNADLSISGKYPNLGTKILTEKGILILDSLGRDIFEKVKEGDEIEIIDNKIYKEKNLLAEGIILTKQIIEEKNLLAKRNLSNELEKFIENTLSYVKEEKSILLEEVFPEDLGINIKGKPVLVVVRGLNFEEDLRALRSYINDMRPVLIGVDGGADTLLEFGYKPDIIIGDMDSVSDEALKSSAKIIIHAYQNGEAPGLKRVENLGLPYLVLPSPGTSEDVALLLAYNQGADMIVGVGMHFSLEDFLEKGRKGMSSTFLVRLKIGNKLFDAKGVSRLYRGGVKISLLFFLILSGLVPIMIIIFTSPLSKPFIRLVRIFLNKNLGI